MNNIITIQELKNSVLNANIDEEYIQPAVTEAQNVYLREILGDLLYETIQNKIDSQTLSGKYLTLVNNYIKPYLSYMVQSLIVVPVNYKIRNAGVVNQYGTDMATTDLKDTKYIQDYYSQKAEFYANRLTTYLQKNQTDIPEYAVSDENITNPTTSQTASPIYLGGGKKRCNGKVSSGTVNTVNWDNIIDRPSFATVATSGEYDDLLNVPEIPIVNNSTIDIYQGGQLKGSFSLNQSNSEVITLDAGGGGGGSTDWSDITNKPNFATVATSGDYNDLQNKPTIPTVPTNVSAFNNDAGYITLNDVPAQVNADWNSNSGASQILNKPTIPTVPTNVSAFNNDSGYITLNDVPAQVNSDWNSNSGVSQILNKPNLSTVATSGSYTDLTDKPTIPTVPTNVSSFNNDAGYITISDVPAQVNADWNSNSGVSQILNKPTIPTVPTDVSSFNNDAGYITSSDIPAQQQANWNESDTTAASYIQNKPTIPAAQVNSDWNSNSGASQILNKPTIPQSETDLGLTSELWSFTLQGGSTVTKTVVLK